MTGPHRLRRVALTGGIATGKSHVRAQFELLGVPTIDSDHLARAAVAPGTAGLASVVERFGTGVLDARGHLDRSRMATLVFGDSEARRALEAIVHPVVRRMTDEWLAGLDPGQHPYALADVPLLYEVGRDRDFDQVIVVACEPDTQIRRLIARDGLSEAEAARRIEAQLPITEKIRRGDYVIRTDAGFEDTNRQIARIHALLTQRTSGTAQPESGTRRGS